MSLMLAPDQVALYRPGELDGHGWREAPPEGSRPYWRGNGNLQLLQGQSSPTASYAGGRGLNDPAGIHDGWLYVPPEAEPVEGSTALIRGGRYVLSQVRLISDPLPGAGLACFAATATEVRGG